MKRKVRKRRQSPATAARLEIIRRNLDKPDAEIGRLLGCCRSAVHQMRRRYQIEKVHATRQREERLVEMVRAMPPGLTLRDVAQRLNFSTMAARRYTKRAGYQPVTRLTQTHFQWQARFKRLPSGLTITEVARKLGLCYSHTALLCVRHGYQTRVRTGKNKLRIPIRNYQRNPKYERWLASLKPPTAG